MIIAHFLYVYIVCPLFCNVLEKSLRLKPILVRGNIYEHVYRSQYAQTNWRVIYLKQLICRIGSVCLVMSKVQTTCMQIFK